MLGAKDLARAVERWVGRSPHLHCASELENKYMPATGVNCISPRFIKIGGRCLQPVYITLPHGGDLLIE